MKNIIYIILLLSLNIANAQNQFGIDTAFLVGTEKQIYDIRKILLDKNNNVYISGFFKDSIKIVNTLLTTKSESNYDYSKAIFLAKYDSNNSFLWAKKIAECDTMGIFSFVIDNDNDYYFAITYTGKLFFENDSILTKGSSDIIILKYDTNNNIMFTSNIGNINGEGLSNNNGVVVDDLNNYIITGSYNSTWTNNYPNYNLVFGSDTITSTTQDIFIAKYDSFGNSIWVKSFGSLDEDGISSVDYSNHNFYILGGGGNNINLGGVILSYPINYYSKCFMVKLNNDGYTCWAKKFGSSDIPGGFGYVKPTSIVNIDEKIYFTGHANSQNQNVFLFDGGSTLNGTGLGSETFIACYDTTGNFKWNKLLNTQNIEYLTQLLTDSFSGIIGVGNIGSNSFTDAGVCSYDSNGNFNWLVGGGGMSTDVGSGIALDSHGKIFIVGGTTSSGGCMMGNDTLYPPANQSTMFFASLDSIDATWPLQNTVQFHESFQIEVYPNPAYKYLYVDMKQVVTQTKNEHTLIKMQNALGQIVYMTQVAEKHSNTPNSLHTIDISSYPNGMYFLSLISDQQAISKKIIIQH
ncbi:MAG: T9SS type A sorting domain-containing protein [Bacteroidetes bacterium]|nr:T9SS type A sorting domain-containing protein [Bacteroidota bacterium]